LFSFSWTLSWETLPPGSAKSEAPDGLLTDERPSDGWALEDGHVPQNGVVIGVGLGALKEGAADAALLADANGVGRITLGSDCLSGGRSAAPPRNIQLEDAPEGVNVDMDVDVDVGVIVREGPAGAAGSTLIGTGIFVLGVRPDERSGERWKEKK
jgi:hypothetical protein